MIEVKKGESNPHSLVFYISSCVFTYCFNAFTGLYEAVLLDDGWIVNILAENITQALQTLDLPLHVLPVFFFYRYCACIFYFNLKRIKLDDAL